MTERMNDRDWRLISAYLDARLSPADTTRVETRLKVDNLFKRSLDEIEYTKRLLTSLPQKRAPRNFTLAAEKVKKPLRGLWLQPALSFVSIAAAVMLVVVYTFNTVGGSMARITAAPQAAMFTTEKAVAEQSAPVIINWNPALGMGGGGAADTKEVYMGGDGIGGAGGPGFNAVQPGAGSGAPLATVEPAQPPQAEPVEELPAAPAPDIPVEPTPEMLAQPAPVTTEAAPAADTDLSTLILGLPEAEKAGTLIETTPLREAPAPVPRRGLPVQTLVMIISGVVALLAGAGALILRKFSHA